MTFFFFFSYQWLGLTLRSRGYLLFLSLPICPRPPYTPFVVKIAFAVVLVAKNKNRINRETKGVRVESPFGVCACGQAYMDMGGLCLRGTKEVTVRAQDPGRSLMITKRATFGASGLR
jgi:hypothetical protein